MENKNILLGELRLAYPPVSSFEADHLISDKEVESILRTSDFYIIATHAEVSFDRHSFCFNEDDGTLSLDIVSQTPDGAELRDAVTLDVAVLEREVDNETRKQGKRVEESMATIIDCGDKVVRFFRRISEGDGEEAIGDCFLWFTPERLIFEAKRGFSGIEGLTRYWDYAQYTVLYVGIAKVGDSFTRLFKQPHHARQAILSSNYPLRTGSRVTDEVILFPFRVGYSQIRPISAEDGLTNKSTAELAKHHKRVVADAEKAFVNVFQPEHNSIKFVAYPKGKDGLYGGDHDRYGYVIAENYMFVGPGGAFRGSWDPARKSAGDSADLVVIEGDVFEVRRGSQNTHLS